MIDPLKTHFKTVVQAIKDYDVVPLCAKRSLALLAGRESLPDKV